MVIIFLEKTLNLSIFTHALLPYSKLPLECFENLFPPTAERDGESHKLFYQTSIRRYEDDLG